jgi:L-rhamnose mutarotase
MPRYCLLGHVDPNRLDEYREAHRAVWPELLETLRDAGWRNYSLFLRDDGLLIGYAEADDLAAAQERLARTEVNARWQAAMSELFQAEGAPDEAWEIIPEVSISKINFRRPVGSPPSLGIAKRPSGLVPFADDR